MWLEEALRVFTRLTAIKPLLQNHLLILKRIKNSERMGKGHTALHYLNAWYRLK